MSRRGNPKDPRYERMRDLAESHGWSERRLARLYGISQPRVHAILGSDRERALKARRVRLVSALEVVDEELQAIVTDRILGV